MPWYSFWYLVEFAGSWRHASLRKPRESSRIWCRYRVMPASGYRHSAGAVAGYFIRGRYYMRYRQPPLYARHHARAKCQKAYLPASNLSPLFDCYIATTQLSRAVAWAALLLLAIGPSQKGAPHLAFTAMLHSISSYCCHKFLKFRGNYFISYIYLRCTRLRFG